MSNDHPYTHQEVRLAQLPHQLFLFNSIGNHVLLTVITISVAMSNPLLILLIPGISAVIIAYTYVRGRLLVRHPCLLVRAHWGIVMRRTRVFLVGYIALATAATAAWLLYTYADAMKELMFALVGGLGLLPMMVLILALTIIESETLSHAGHGFVPPWAWRRFGTEAEVRALEERLNDTADAAS
ncbi:hypothetical protein Tel_07395 [Candidatus Tenderia electrophaga]|jgi:glucose-6-phosphate-specific signal transduction histidine kinase|uniref:Uncharacterized protein n=1 Tax=Candidatus Tenderia electrophaga TaxID=1748243 RepID=A0A0S2TCV6_9GAMM|nr:hypothetical protein Tel_07395 [Candidatus Tenderia electrophaga]